MLTHGAGFGHCPYNDRRIAIVSRTDWTDWLSMTGLSPIVATDLDILS
jgi:hypothetical protein